MYTLKLVQLEEITRHIVPFLKGKQCLTHGGSRAAHGLIAPEQGRGIGQGKEKEETSTSLPLPPSSFSHRDCS